MPDTSKTTEAVSLVLAIVQKALAGDVKNNRELLTIFTERFLRNSQAFDTGDSVADHHTSQDGSSGKGERHADRDRLRMLADIRERLAESERLQIRQPAMVYKYDTHLWVRWPDNASPTKIDVESGHGEIYPRLHPSQPRILFHDRQRGYADFDIFTVNADGSNRTRLTDHHARDESFPTWSPDGSWIAFSYWKKNEGSSIYVMRADGSEVFRLTTFPFVGCKHLSWSPDGTRIACVGSTREPDGSIGHEELYLVNVMSGHAKRITHTYDQEVRHFTPAWHPSGDALAFSRGWKPSGGRAHYNLYLVLVGGMAVFPFPMQLTTHPAVDTSPTFSGDGRFIAFMSNRQIAADDADVILEDTFNLFKMKIDGTEWEQLTWNGGANPDWR